VVYTQKAQSLTTCSRVFGREDGKITGGTNNDSEEREEWEDYARRSAARKAAENSTTLSSMCVAIIV
jgi:hypothetical protein